MELAAPQVRSSPFLLAILLCIIFHLDHQARHTSSLLGIWSYPLYVSDIVVSSYLYKMKYITRDKIRLDAALREIAELKQENARLHKKISDICRIEAPSTPPFTLHSSKSSHQFRMSPSYARATRSSAMKSQSQEDEACPPTDWSPKCKPLPSGRRHCSIKSAGYLRETEATHQCIEHIRWETFVREVLKRSTLERRVDFTKITAESPSESRRGRWLAPPVNNYTRPTHTTDANHTEQLQASTFETTEYDSDHRPSQNVPTLEVASRLHEEYTESEITGEDDDDYEIMIDTATGFKFFNRVYELVQQMVYTLLLEHDFVRPGGPHLMCLGLTELHAIIGQYWGPDWLAMNGYHQSEVYDMIVDTVSIRNAVCLPSSYTFGKPWSLDHKLHIAQKVAVALRNYESIVEIRTMQDELVTKARESYATDQAIRLLAVLPLFEAFDCATHLRAVYECRSDLSGAGPLISEPKEIFQRHKKEG
ncbi:hypothetical protein F5Y16DRAFT_418280 [Xylariaceae sp. FL0255]|nr:hypothetical protein F5Y16DRAFT_418280 [Xylariaceae sp. FL0255]